MKIIPLQCKLFVFYRFVDDCFSAFNNQKKTFTDIEKILSNIQLNIAFTAEMQSKNCLIFLNVLVDNDGHNLITSSFSKSTHITILSSKTILSG